MITTIWMRRSFAAALFFICSLGYSQIPLGTSFTYQALLNDAGQPANGPHDLQFRLFDSLTDGVQIGPLVCFDGQDVVDGLIMVSLDFGTAFDGEQRFLQIAVRADTTQGNCDVAGGYSTLSPRQMLSASPNSAFALNAGTLDGLDSASFLQAVPVPLVLSGNDTAGVIRGINSSAVANSAGVYGENTATGTGARFGGRFVSQGSTATGVLGEGLGSLGTGGAFRGGGIGLSARATNPNVNGGVAVSAVCEAGSLGKGVSALVTAPTSETFGVSAESQSNQGTGVFGLASSNSGSTTGVLGEAESSSGTGVSGLASADTGQTIGVLGQTESDLGIGVYGFANNGGVAVRGDVLFADATAGVFSNVSSPERIVELSGPNGAINTTGFLNREYTANTPRRAIPIAYGSIGTTGTINGGTGNFTVSHTVTGEYDITINGEPYSNLTFVVTITPITNSPRVTGVADAGEALRVNMWNMSSTLVDDDFQFTVWEANPN